MIRAGLWLVVLTGLAVGCAPYPVNPALKTLDRETGYRFDKLRRRDGNTDKTFVILTLSGGGTRAAALSYGVLDLRRERIEGDRKSLLDEVDVISSVSGGSFAAAYYGLFGEEAFFQDFKEAVLYRKIQRDLILRILAPRELASPALKKVRSQRSRRSSILIQEEGRTRCFSIQSISSFAPTDLAMNGRPATLPSSLFVTTAVIIRTRPGYSSSSHQN